MLPRTQKKNEEKLIWIDSNEVSCFMKLLLTFEHLDWIEKKLIEFWLKIASDQCDVMLIVACLTEIAVYMFVAVNLYGFPIVHLKFSLVS